MSDNTMQAYCVKCKAKRDMQNVEAVFTASGTPGTKGICPVCGTSMYRMGATEAHNNLAKPTVTAAPKAKTASKSTKSTKAKSTKGKKGSKKKATKTTPRRKNVGKLVIVESPAKARSIGGYLGKGYTVMASKGHVRDLLKTQLSVDVDP